MSLSSYNYGIGFSKDQTYDVVDSEQTDNIIFFDTKKIEKKLLCYKRKIDTKNKCYIINVIFTNNNKERFESLTRTKLNVIFEFPFNEKNCDFSWFYSEYLFCCSGNDIISCYRINDDFEIVNQFGLNINGQNSNLKIINNTNYASLFYINEEDDSETKLFEYIIYPPICQNISKEIIVFHDFEINITFDMKTNNSYYLKFYNLPQDYDNIKSSFKV